MNGKLFFFEIIIIFIIQKIYLKELFYKWKKQVFSLFFDMLLPNLLICTCIIFFPPMYSKWKKIWRWLDLSIAYFYFNLWITSYQIIKQVETSCVLYTKWWKLSHGIICNNTTIYLVWYKNKKHWLSGSHLDYLNLLE